MNKRIKAKWLEALRSGKYKQGRERLRDVNKGTATYEYCCLGVLADCAAMDWDQRFANVDDEVMPLCEMDLLPTNVADRRYGLDLVAQKELAEMNDEGATFTVIADWIEQEL